MKAGAFTPATPSHIGLPLDPGRALNEGGGLHPRNACAARVFEGVESRRSMKAGAFTPATLDAASQTSHPSLGAQ